MALRVLEMLASPVWTGPAEPMASVARFLAGQGHAVDVAVDTRREGDLRGRLAGMGLSPRGDLALSTRSGPVTLWADARRLRRIAGDYDVLHANFSHDHTLALLATARRRPARVAGPRVVRTVHSSRSLEPRLLQRWATRRTDGLIAVCEGHAQILVERFGVEPRRVLAVRGAVDSQRFAPEGPDLRAELGIPAGVPVVGIVSRVKSDRRHRELVDAFEVVAAALPQARLVVVGRGEGLEELRVRIVHRGLGDRVILAGYRMDGALADAYRTLDVKVLLAEGNDGSCRALLESMACGRPAVAYRFGAPAEAIVDGTTGLLVEPGEVGALAQALLELLRAPARARAMGLAGRERVAALYTERARGAAIERFLAEIRSLPPA
jgi:glycosyltransferase involved in cell wall biosynthesis